MTGARVLVTGATGRLGRLVIEHLATTVDPARVVAGARDPERAAPLADLGVEVRHLDYDEPATVRAAIEGVSRVLLVSGTELGARVRQHATVINACAEAGMGRIVYTSFLRADRSSLPISADHRETEAQLATCGVPHTILRNGWYLDNHTENLEPARVFGTIFGSAGEARICAATRDDLAAAAAAALTGPLGGDGTSRTYELAGHPFTMADLAAAVADTLDRPISYTSLDHDGYAEILAGDDVPGDVVALLTAVDRAALAGELDAPTGDLEHLLGRPPTPLADAVRAACA